MNQLVRIGERRLSSLDPFCPHCGHNRNTSSVSTIDKGDGRHTCQMCGALWREFDSAALSASQAANRTLVADTIERCAKVCEDYASEDGGFGFLAAVRHGVLEVAARRIRSLSPEADDQKG